MSSRANLVSWLWKIPLCGLIYTLGLMAGGLLIAGLGLPQPSLPFENPPILLVLAGGMIIALGLAVMAGGLAGRFAERWAVLGMFAFIVNGVANVLESNIFTNFFADSGEVVAAAVVPLPASLLCGLAVAWLFPAPAVDSLSRSWRAFRAGRSGTTLTGRLVLAVLAFPFVYWTFGMMIAPIVVPHYAELDFLVIPPPLTILGMQILRGAMFLLVSLPILVGWRRSRRGLALALGLGHYTAVGLSGLVQVTFFPALLRWVHGVEILADSFVYAALLVWLLVPRESPRRVSRQALEGPAAAG